MSAITRINATIPKTLADYAELRVRTGNFGNKSEYIRHLIRQDQESSRESQVAWLNAVLAKSEASGVISDSRDDLLSAGRSVIEKIATRSE